MTISIGVGPKGVGVGGWGGAVVGRFTPPLFDVNVHFVALALVLDRTSFSLVDEQAKTKY